MKFKYVKVTIAIAIGLLLLKILFLSPSNIRTRIKLELIKNELSKRGYSPSWVIVSEKRSELYNSLLSNSVKNSYHLEGRAIDIFVFDINSDGVFNSYDIGIFRKATIEVEKEHPGLKGAIGTYTNKKFPSNRMIHIDTRGYSVYYNY